MIQSITTKEYDDIFNNLIENIQNKTDDTEKLRKQFFNNFITPIAYTLIAGDYFNNDFSYKLNKYIKDTQDNISNVINDSDLEQYTAPSPIFNIIISIFKTIKDFYNLLLSSDLSNSNPVFYSEKVISINIMKENFDNDYVEYIEYINTIIDICRIEYLQLYNLQSYDKLLKYIDFYKYKIQNLEIKTSFLTKILNDKILLILRIISHSYAKNKALEYLDKLSGFDCKQNFETKEFENFDQQIEFLTRDNNRYNHIADSDDIKRPTKDLYKNIYYANKIEISLNSLQKLQTNYSKVSQKDKKGLYKSYSTSIDSTNELYLNNCILSSKVKLKNFATVLNEDLSFKNQGVSNYYHITRKIDYLICIIDTLQIDSVEQCQQYLNTLDMYIDELNSVRFSTIVAAIIPFRIPVDESIYCVKDNEISYRVLLLNQFVKQYSPEDTKEIIENKIFKVYEYIAKLSMRIEQIQLKQFIQNETLQLNNKYSQFKKKNDNFVEKLSGIERRSIEIIGIFAAIVIFAAAEFNFATQIQRIDIMVVAMLFFGFILLGFIYLLLYILDPHRKLTTEVINMGKTYKIFLFSGLGFNLIYLILSFLQAIKCF